MTEETFAPIFRASNSGLFDAFEHWLQGRVNLCVTGLQDQITRLEIQNNELRKALTQLENGEMRDMSLRFKEFFDQEMEIYWQTHDINNQLDERSVWEMVEDKVEEAIDDKLETEGVGMSDEDFQERVRDIVRDNLSFEVSVL